MAALAANMAALESTEMGEARNNAKTCEEGRVQEEIVEEKVEESEETNRQNLSPSSSESTAKRNPKATPSQEEIAAVCSKLFIIGRNQNLCQPSFSGKYRAEIGRLLATYTHEELYEGYAEFVKHRDDFEMRQAPKTFVEGGADDFVAPIREQKRKRQELVAKWRQDQIDRHRALVEEEVLLEQERTGSEEQPTSPLYQRCELAKKLAGTKWTSNFDQWDLLRELRAAAAKTPEIQQRVNDRLAAQPFDPGPCHVSDGLLEQRFGVSS